MSAPPTPTQKSSWSRMRGAVRRASIVLTATKPPSVSGSDRERDADTASLKGSIKAGSIKNIATSLLSSSSKALPAHVSAPSPIAESPVRENEATLQSLFSASSPLAQPSEDYTPPPLIDSTATGPGGFTDDPDELPQSQVIQDPFLVQPPVQDPPEPAASDESVVPAPIQELAVQPASEPAPAPAPADGALRSVPTPEPAAPSTAQGLVSPGPSTVLAPTTVKASGDPESIAEPAPPLIPTAPATPDTDHRLSQESVPTIPSPEHPSYFGIPLVEEPVQQPDRPSSRHPDPRDRSLAVTPPPPSSTQPVLVQPVQEFMNQPVYHPPVMPAPEPVPRSDSSIFPLPIPVAMPGFELAASHDVWGRDPPRQSMPDPNPPESEPPHRDPFADPIAPRITFSNHGDDYPLMPEPQAPKHDSDYSPDTHGTPTGVVMPLPPINQLIPSRSLQQSARGPIDTDETVPLLSRPRSPKSSYLHPIGSRHAVTISPPASGAHAPTSSWTVHTSSLHDLGWIEYQLPDGTVYYVHPTRRITADIDFRDEKKLAAVMAYLDNHRSIVPVGMELWIREGEFTKKTFVPRNFWVDHGRRTVILNQPKLNGDAGFAKKHVDDDDQLDMEYRYWSFIESHPAHTSLPPNARAEALDVLTWAWTDRLLPSHRTIPAPFTQEECQELMSLLRSFGSEQGSDTGFQAIVHSRIVSRILLRVAHWRQQFFRPNRPLPADVGNHPTPRRRPVVRVALDIVVSCLCLGIPYFFFDRHRHARFDEESGGLRNPGPILVVGACTCLIAAIVLSASVTFLSLPGLDNLSRIAGLVSILCASFSITSTGVAIFKYKSDLGHPAAPLGMEGLMLLSRRSFVLSLPLVFLAYAIIAFISGVVLYIFRGVTLDPVLPTRPFDDHTRWTVVGVLGGFAGVLSTSLLLLK